MMLGVSLNVLFLAHLAAGVRVDGDVDEDAHWTRGDVHTDMDQSSLFEDANRERGMPTMTSGAATLPGFTGDKLSARNANEQNTRVAAEGGKTERSKVKGEHLDRKFVNPEIVFELQCVDCLMKAADRNYFLAEGTLLGTVRDGFFLPWDADGDIVFDVQNKTTGQQDFDGFYRLFTPGPFGTGDMQKCPGCGNMQVSLFLTPEGKQIVIDGVQMHYFQSYGDILSGSLAAFKGGTKHFAHKELHEKILNISRQENAARIIWNQDPQTRTGGHGYIDVAPYYVHENEGKVLVRENITKNLTLDDVFPLVDCQTVAFQENGTRTVDLRCPNKPRAYLDQTYKPNGWQKAPYNKFDPARQSQAGPLGQWIKEGSGTLEEFVKNMYNYSGDLAKNHIW